MFHRTCWIPVAKSMHFSPCWPLHSACMCFMVCSRLLQPAHVLSWAKRQVMEKEQCTSWEQDLHIFPVHLWHANSCIQATHSSAWPGTHTDAPSVPCASLPGSGLNCCFVSLGSSVVAVTLPLPIDYRLQEKGGGRRGGAILWFSWVFI